MNPRLRRRALLVAALAALLGVGWVASWATREPSGPPSSSYATSPDGVAAYADLLGRFGHPLQRLRTALSESDLSSATTVVVLDAGTLSQEDVSAAQDFLVRGGRIVVAGTPPGALLRCPPRPHPRPG